ncbi:metallophosphoesterase [Polaromonas eurypsychrophila]|uniref:Calcineurin-like phosphoesterase n=1 Tax=Polaromonas eurypsychrophila TaxID=1614635 RepID=A0A916S8S6_9BURK|nr:metallophosphoesterase [Polaromonas eurypsychrophila]GGA86452.1 calcineurin-like phosphoesterase [Polaromonas eurypsychrophila]
MSLFFFSLFLHAYLGVRLIPALAAWPVAQLLLGLSLLASMVLMPMGLTARRFKSPLLADRVTWTGMLFMGLFSSVFVLSLLREAALLAGWLWLLVRPGTFSWPGLNAGSAAAVALLGLLMTFLGFFNARRTAAVVRVEVPIVGLPTALHGFSIAQISDIHVGPTIKRGYLQAIVNVVNELQVDMVAVTGDLVDGTVADLAPHVAPLAGLSSVHGTYFVTGNHEYYSGAHAWIQELNRLGVRVLMNEHVVLPHGLVLAGVADWSAGHFDSSHRSDPHAALAGSPANAAFRLLLAHQPRSAVEAEKAGFDLQLSGHTHGGQFWPWGLFVRFQQPFTAGLHRLENLWIYTSRGTGYWGPPKRFGAPSEITCLRLVTVS